MMIQRWQILVSGSKPKSFSESFGQINGTCTPLNKPPKAESAETSLLILSQAIFKEFSEIFSLAKIFLTSV